MATHLSHGMGTDNDASPGAIVQTRLESPYRTTVTSAVVGVGPSRRYLSPSNALIRLPDEERRMIKDGNFDVYDGALSFLRLG